MPPSRRGWGGRTVDDPANAPLRPDAVQIQIRHLTEALREVHRVVEDLQRTAHRGDRALGNLYAVSTHLDDVETLGGWRREEF